MSYQRLLILLPLLALVVGCFDDDNYVVASQEQVDRSELPKLDEFDWHHADLESYVASEAHAKAVPEADWPGPIGKMLQLVVKDSEGNLPEEFDLPVDDRCLYVGMDRRRPSWRIEHQKRNLFLIPYRIASSESTDEMPAGQYLAVLDESQDLRRYDFAILSRNLRFLKSESRLSMVEQAGGRILLREIRYDGTDIVISAPVVLVDSSGQIENWAVELGVEGAVSVAWSYRKDPSGRRYPLFYSEYGGQSATEEVALRLTRSSVGGDIKLTLLSGEVFVSWLDSRFESGFVGRQHISKLFFTKISSGGSSFGRPVVLNRPFDAADGASDPRFVTIEDGRLIVLWSTTLTGDLQLARLRFAALDYGRRSLALSEQEVEEERILDAATSRMQEEQRSNPIGDLPAPRSEECDTWEEKVDSLPLLKAGPIDIHGRPMPLIEGSMPLPKEHAGGEEDPEGN